MNNHLSRNVPARYPWASTCSVSFLPSAVRCHSTRSPWYSDREICVTISIYRRILDSRDEAFTRNLQVWSLPCCTAFPVHELAVLFGWGSVWDKLSISQASSHHDMLWASYEHVWFCVPRGLFGDISLVDFRCFAFGGLWRDPSCCDVDVDGRMVPLSGILRQCQAEIIWCLHCAHCRHIRQHSLIIDTVLGWRWHCRNWGSSQIRNWKHAQVSWERNYRSRDHPSLITYPTTNKENCIVSYLQVKLVNLLNFWARGIGWSAMHKHRHNIIMHPIPAWYTYQPNRSF